MSPSDWSFARLVISDLHETGDRAAPCDRAKLTRVRDLAIARQVREVVVAGDGPDVTREGDDANERAGRVLGEHLVAPLTVAGIPVTCIGGNHDPYARLSGRFLHGLIRAGAVPTRLQLAEAYIQRGPWVISHGHSLDPTCDGGPFTKVGEWFTRLDHLLDHVGCEIEHLNVASWEPGPGEEYGLDHPVNRAAYHSAKRQGLHLVVGHSHHALDIGGSDRGRPWRVLNPGAFTVSAPFTFAWILDTGEGGLEGDWEEVA